ncbi:Leucine Rich Repeat [Seminavis robusta]|uniref:Leucine Rich Repeat n=1 Tax=Seminavis robusta TaxID=568900 RepID=A0A9N8ECL8_9STRA|nr:Leucine Rich Repeat [Seminavis robusta]|eukprot:Sro895_g217150.1 Leucine Rich Repeat (670) ;mRNA; f:11286-13674
MEKDNYRNNDGCNIAESRGGTGDEETAHGELKPEDRSNKENDDTFNLLDVVATRSQRGTANAAEAEHRKLASFDQAGTNRKPKGNPENEANQKSDLATIANLPPAISAEQSTSGDDLDMLKVVELRQRIQGIGMQENATDETQTGGSESQDGDFDTSNNQEQLSVPAAVQQQINGEQAQEMSATGIVPPPLAREYNVVRRQDSQPGAFAMAGPGLDEEDHVIVIDEDDRPSNPTAPIIGQNSGLSVATLVDEDAERPQDMPQAAEFITTTTPTSQRKTKTSVLVILGLIVIIIIILAAVLVPRQRETDTDEAVRTLSPSAAPASFEDYALSLLPAETRIAIDDDPEKSPQTRAFNWLLEDINIAPDLPEKRLIQRFILATLYYSTGGDRWFSNTNWLNYSVHECDWHNEPSLLMMDTMSKAYSGFLEDFFPSDEPPPTTCDEEGLYQHLWLDQNNLAGSLPEEINWLTSLLSISVTRNYLEGTISTGVGRLTKLIAYSSSFMVHDEHIRPIPSQFGLLSSLRLLGLVGNNHQGSIPTELGLLGHMEHLALGQSHQLKGTIPCCYAKLSWLTLEECDLTGTIPTELGQSDPLEIFLVDDNKFSGTVPTLGKSLHTLSLEENPQLSGTIPEGLCHLNGTCIQSNFVDPCPPRYNLSFACTSLLCGCDCPCV